MTDPISEYQKWKSQGASLRSQAKEAIESRFRELLLEAVQLAEEYRADFGGPLKPPASITAFRYKAGAKGKAKKSAKAGAVTKPGRLEARPEPAAPKSNPKIAGLQKKLAASRKKLEEAKSAGAPTRALEDRIYEIEDTLRLANQA